MAKSPADKSAAQDLAADGTGRFAGCSAAAVI